MIKCRCFYSDDIGELEENINQFLLSSDIAGSDIVNISFQTGTINHYVLIFYKTKA
jgi:hypothetical protein